MTEADLDTLLAQYPGWTAIGELVQTVREQAAVMVRQQATIEALQQVLGRWYTEGELRRRPDESEEAFRARYLALRNATVTLGVKGR